MTNTKKTFDIRKWLDSAPKHEDHETTFLGETVKIRVLRGPDWEEFINAYTLPNDSGVSIAETLLYHGIVAPGGGKHTREEIHELFKGYTRSCSKLAQEIRDISQKALFAEIDETEQAEKNSETTGTAEPCIDGAGTTEPTHEQPN